MKKFSFLIVFLLLVVGGFFAWFINGSMPPDTSDKTTKTFSVRKGDTVRSVANNLKSQGLIKDPVVFFLIIKQMGLDQKIQAGDFLLSPSMNARKIASSLQTGSYDVRIVIPEGKRAEEIADILRDRVDSYDESWREQLVQHEGYLFPDTYSFSKEVTIEQVLATLRDNFDKKYATIPNNNKLTQQEIVTIASMVEREARHDRDRPLVASVILNRYRIGMKLDIDATIQYALGYQNAEKDWWKKELSFDDLALNSPYNTYRVAGLPPTPIANPGLAALSAVANPATTDYLFYISDKNGNNHYAKTNEEHEANKRKYGL